MLPQEWRSRCTTGEFKLWTTWNRSEAPSASFYRTLPPLILPHHPQPPTSTLHCPVTEIPLRPALSCPMPRLTRRQELLLLASAALLRFESKWPCWGSRWAYWCRKHILVLLFRFQQCTFTSLHSETVYFFRISSAPNSCNNDRSNTCNIARCFTVRHACCLVPSRRHESSVQVPSIPELFTDAKYQSKIAVQAPTIRRSLHVEETRPEIPRGYWKHIDFMGAATGSVLVISLVGPLNSPLLNSFSLLANAVSLNALIFLGSQYSREREMLLSSMKYNSRGFLQFGI